jgi:hypothetical protein
MRPITEAVLFIMTGNKKICIRNLVQNFCKVKYFLSCIFLKHFHKISIAAVLRFTKKKKIASNSQLKRPLSLLVRGSNPGGGEIFRTCPNRPWGPLSFQYNGCRVFPGDKERPGCDANPSPLLVPWSWKCRAIPVLPLWAVRPVQSLSAYTRVHFT